ncbi:glycosyltransferase family 2 protein [Shouchella lehensis]|uniref:Glycosyl transferase, family 2 n=1 Tax=Shouchella lehensis G1 TaxID=1246626 RepID=A0A060M7R0_9BACI|nr:glycosyltransferase family 2 protein [Shouchella lehensis]AIC96099.1 Glycosyl transferase, family 2 [Shouchella lehensis G1]
MNSVCMAVYNGEKHVKIQLESILEQLSIEDEIVIVNDNSTDSSLNIINKINDNRIKVINNDENIGVIKSFEKAINLSKGKYIFLSDQDDKWYPNKVTDVIKTFNENDCLLLVSDATVVNDDLEVIHESFFNLLNSGEGLVKNFIKNTFLGCSIVFKKDLKEKILPFPDGIPMHDTWIGLVASLHSKPMFLKKPLIYYRRHAANVTSLKRERSVVLVARDRAKLLLLLSKRVIRDNRFKKTKVN